MMAFRRSAPVMGAAVNSIALPISLVVRILYCRGQLNCVGSNPSNFLLLGVSEGLPACKSVLSHFAIVLLCSSCLRPCFLLLSRCVVIYFEGVVGCCAGCFLATNSCLSYSFLPSFLLAFCVPARFGSCLFFFSCCIALVTLL